MYIVTFSSRALRNITNTCTTDTGANNDPRKEEKKKEGKEEVKEEEKKEVKEEIGQSREDILTYTVNKPAEIEDGAELVVTSSRALSTDKDDYCGVSKEAHDDDGYGMMDTKTSV